MSEIRAAIEQALTRYESDDNLGVLLDTLRAAARKTDVDELIAAADTCRDRPEAAIPLYERITAERPTDARALVALANAYWLTGRGPDVVGELAERAKAADPTNRAAWHLWALAQSNVRKRVERWQEVSRRFPQDQLARAALADNATSLAGGEHDPAALSLAIETYEGLLMESTAPAQRRALEQTLETLRGWKL
jgi:tetratricopeptide (TPR) repeat protein